MSKELEDFGKLLVENVRDQAIKGCDRIFEAEHVIAKRWKDAAASGCSPEQFAKTLIPDIVDQTISRLLGAVDQELIRLSFVASNGTVIDLATVATESGELSGWYMGAWREKYTKERFVDDFADLKRFFENPAP